MSFHDAHGLLWVVRCIKNRCCIVFHDVEWLLYLVYVLREWVRIKTNSALKWGDVCSISLTEHSFINRMPESVYVVVFNVRVQNTYGVHCGPSACALRVWRDTVTR